VRSLRSILVVLTVVAVGVLLVVPVAHADPGTDKVTLLKNPSGTCNIGATGGVDSNAFAVVQFHDGRVASTVSLKDGLANTSYAVTLVQVPSGENCFTSEATLTTNKQGNGTVHLDEALLAGSTGAFVIVFDPSFADFRASKAVSPS